MLASTFYLVSIFGAALACSPMANGEEKLVDIDISQIVVPIPWTVAQNTSVAGVYPTISTSATQVQEKIKTVASDALHTVIEKQLPQGLGNARSQLEQQITMTVRYEPLSCENYQKLDIPQTPEPSQPITNGYRCFLSNDNTITKLCNTQENCKNQGGSKLEVPPQFTTIRAELRIRNVFIAGWSSNDWNRIARDLEKLLRFSPYSATFANALIKANS